MSRTSLDVDDVMLDRAMRSYGLQTKREAHCDCDFDHIASCTGLKVISGR